LFINQPHFHKLKQLTKPGRDPLKARGERREEGPWPGSKDD